MINYNKKILVLGSNSFGGACYIDHALNDGYNVIGINRSKESKSCFLPYINNKNRKKYNFFNLHLVKDTLKIIHLLEAEKPDYIVDFAGQGMVAESWENPILWYETNFISKVRIHEYLKDKKWLKKYIRISTPEVYGSNLDPVSEEQNLNPSTPYAVSHAAIDMSLMSYSKNYNFPVILGRFANFYGPGQQLYRIIPKTILCAKAGKKLPLHGGGLSVRAFIHGNDISNAITKMINKGNKGEVYNFSTTELISIKQLVIKILDMMDVSFENSVIETQDRPSKDFSYFMETNKAKKYLSWKPQISLEDGIKSTIDWVNNNYETLNRMPCTYQHKL